MFETYFTKPSAIAGHRSKPLARERERFLAYMEECGSGRATIRTSACYLLQIVRVLEMHRLRDVTSDEVKRAAERWSQHRDRYSLHQAGQSSICVFGRIARRWLRFEGRLKSQPVRQAFSRYLHDFVQAMTLEQGLAETTIRHRRNRVGAFLKWYAKKHRKLSEISIANVDAYIDREGSGWILVTLASVSNCLRAFFRHAESRGWCLSGISISIRSPQIRRDLFDPVALKWSEVLRILRETKGLDPADIRAKAVLTLFALYGLRVSEAGRIRLADIDWRNGTITIRRAKHGGFQQFPLHDEVAHAIRHYIEIARPNCSCPNVFVTIRGPYHPLTSGAIMSIVKSRMQKLGIHPRPSGPQSIRHACATRLLFNGASFPEIADFLGHRDCHSVGVYAKLNPDLLREVSDLDLAGTL
jgi:site-specific recombinase XerD